MLKNILTQYTNRGMEIDLDKGPLEAYMEEIESVSMEGLLEKVKDLFDTSPNGKELEEVITKRNYRKLASMVKDTLGNERWVRKRFRENMAETVAPVNQALFQINGKVVTPATAIDYFETVYVPYMSTLRGYAEDIDAAISEIISWVENIVTNTEDEDKVDAAVKRAIADYQKLKRPIERAKLPSPAMPGNHVLIKDGRMPKVIVKPKLDQLASVPSATVDDIVKVGKWIADTITNVDMESFVTVMGGDHSDGSEFNERFQENFEHAYDKFYDVFYHQALDQDLNGFVGGLWDWYDHADYCIFAIRWCMQSLKAD